MTNHISNETPRRFDDTSPPPDFLVVAANGMRLAVQAFGLVLMLVGGYFAIQIVSDVLSAMRHPAEMEQTFAAMATAAGLEGQAIQLGDARVVVGKMTAVFVLLFGYLICTFIALKLAATGARLVFGAAAERRETYQAMRDMAASMRYQQEREQAARDARRE